MSDNKSGISRCEQIKKRYGVTYNSDIHNSFGDLHQIPNRYDIGYSYAELASKIRYWIEDDDGDPFDVMNRGDYSRFDVVFAGKSSDHIDDSHILHVVLHDKLTDKYLVDINCIVESLNEHSILGFGSRVQTPATDLFRSRFGFTPGFVFTNEYYDGSFGDNKVHSGGFHNAFEFNSFKDCMCFLNREYWFSEYLGKSIPVPISEISRMDYIDDISMFQHSEYGDSLEDCYINIGTAISSGKEIGLAFTTIGESEEIPIQVSVNLTDYVFLTETSPDNPEESFFVEYRSYDDISELIEDVPLDFDALTSYDEHDIDKVLTGGFLAQAYKTLTGEPVIEEPFMEKLHLFSLSNDIYNKPATVAGVIKLAAEKDPAIKDKCDRFLSLMDQFCELTGDVSDEILHNKARDLRDDCRGVVGDRADRHNDGTAL